MGKLGEDVFDYRGRPLERAVPPNPIRVLLAERLPGEVGVFTSRALADEWIRRHRLSGVLTAYPLDEGCFEGAKRCGVLADAAVRQLAKDSQLVGSFTTAVQDHFHYREGEGD